MAARIGGAPAMIERDIAIVICSRGRETVLTRLLDDLERGFLPALAAGDLGASVFVYAQGYGSDFLASLEARFAAAIAEQRLVLLTADRHASIGGVVRTALARVHDIARYRLAMLMDDDSLYDPDPRIDLNLADAARCFLDSGHRAYSIKLGDGRTLEYVPFIDRAGPIMPFKEKMLWTSRAVLDDVLALPRFAELSIGEDAVIAATAWMGDAEACFGVYGIATFRHLGFEPSSHGEGAIAGGYAELVDYAGTEEATHGKYDAALRDGVTPHHLMPHVFVGEEHPHFIYNGIRPEAVARYWPERERVGDEALNAS